MKLIKFIFTSLFVLFTTSYGLSQTSEQGGLDQTLHESGKIYIVVSVLSVIFIGIIFFLIKTELKIKKLEREIRN